MSHTAPRPPSRWSTGAARFGALGIVLLVLYYSVTATLEMRELRQDLTMAQQETEAARAVAGEERAQLLVRLDTLQTDLDNARAEVASLREQLITAGITPVTVPASSAPQDELDSDQPAPTPQAAAGGPETAPQAQTPAQPAPGAPGPAQPANPAAPVPAAPVPPADPTVTVGGDHLLCVLTICL